MDNNSVVLSGVITDELKFSHNIYGEDYYAAPMEITRCSGTKDVVNLLISDRILYQDEKLLNEYVYVYGNIRTKNEQSDRRLCVNVLVDQIDVLDVSEIQNDENYVNITGYICKINPVRLTPKGRVVCDIILAVNRQYGRNDYIPCIFWGKNAGYVNSLNIGTEINISGRLQSRTYVKNDNTRTTYEVSVQSFEAIEDE